jgi:RNA polymerase sigma-70 factor (ECF subfamily)
VTTADLEWVTLARQKDQEAFARLVETYQRPVYNLCYRMLGSEVEAEEAAQETFWRAYQALHRYDPNRSFATWLLSIAAHYCIDQQRKRRVPVLELDAEPELEAPDPSPTPEKVVVRTEEQRQIQSLLGSLSEQDRAVVVLRYWNELSEEEISRTTGLTVSAVKSRLHRARKVMAQAWLEKQPKATAARRQYESPTL